MGLIRWLFRTKSAAPARLDKAIPGSAFDDRFIEIPSRKFYGQFSRSPNKRYTLAWRDANDSGTEGGARRRGKGRYILLDGDRIVAEGQMERPNDGKAANTGVFILNDWKFDSSLVGDFCVSIGTQF